MISTLERLALLEAGGRLGVATQVTVRPPRVELEGWHGWRAARPLVQPRKLLAACMLKECRGV